MLKVAGWKGPLARPLAIGLRVSARWLAQRRTSSLDMMKVLVLLVYSERVPSEPIGVVVLTTRFDRWCCTTLWHEGKGGRQVGSARGEGRAGTIDRAGRTFGTMNAMIETVETMRMPRPSRKKIMSTLPTPRMYLAAAVAVVKVVMAAMMMAMVRWRCT